MNSISSEDGCKEQILIINSQMWKEFNKYVEKKREFGDDLKRFEVIIFF